MDPIILFFVLGVAAGLLKSELKLPAAVYELITLTLLLGIGLKGGQELARQSALDLLPQVAAVVVTGAILCMLAFPLLRRAGGLSRADAAAVSAHYGSVSVGTYAVAAAFLAAKGIRFEEHMPLLLVSLEIPAIIVGILLAKGVRSGLRLGPVLREVVLGKSIVLLVGGMLVGWIAGPGGLDPIRPLFFDLFPGILALFLLEMGLITARHLPGLKKVGPFIILFGVAWPLVSGAAGALLGILLGLSPGGIVMLTTMMASASYIAAPAAIRISVPDANPAISLGAALGITFPFNVAIGIPLYYTVIDRLLP